MSHPVELIQRIAGMLHKDYDPQRFAYVFEKSIKGTRMLPDIAIRASDAGPIVCAVEIGYTRPEKLTAYRKMGIPDVRWYDKSGGLHADVQERVLHIETRLVPLGDMRVYVIEDQVACYESACVQELMCEEPSDDELFNLQHDDVMTFLVTDQVKVFMPTVCNKCGHRWMADPLDEGLSVFSELSGANTRELARLFGPADVIAWDLLVGVFKEQLGLGVRYEDGEFIDAGTRSQFHQERDSFVRILQRER